MGTLYALRIPYCTQGYVPAAMGSCIADQRGRAGWDANRKLREDEPTRRLPACASRHVVKLIPRRNRHVERHDVKRPGRDGLVHDGRVAPERCL